MGYNAVRRRPTRRRVGQVNIITPQDVRDVAGWVERAGISLASSVKTCTTLKPETLTAWTSAKATVDAWSTRAADVGWTTSELAALYREGRTHVETLRGWYDRLRAEGCTVPATPDAPKGPFLSTANPELVPQGFTSFLGELPPLATMLLAYLVLRELR